MEQKNNNKKLIISIVVMAFIALIIWSMAIGLYYYNKQENEPVARQELQIENTTYEKISIERANSGPLVRFVYNVLIKEEVSKQELIQISEAIVKEVIEERAGFQALAIHYYTDKRLTDYPPALGSYTYAPNGDWGNAGEGKADFSNYRGDSSELAEKDWKDKPTEKEIEMFKLASGFDETNEGIKAVAIKYDIEFEKAREHIDKVNRWIYR